MRTNTYVLLISYWTLSCDTKAEASCHPLKRQIYTSSLYCVAIMTIKQGNLWTNELRRFNCSVTQLLEQNSPCALLFCDYSLQLRQLSSLNSRNSFGVAYRVIMLNLSGDIDYGRLLSHSSTLLPFLQRGFIWQHILVWPGRFSETFDVK